MYSKFREVPVGQSELCDVVNKSYLKALESKRSPKLACLSHLNGFAPVVALKYIAVGILELKETQTG